MPDPLKQKSAQSDHPVQRKRPKRGMISTFLLFHAKAVFSPHFGRFSDLSDRIELISFRVSQAS